MLWPNATDQVKSITTVHIVLNSNSLELIPAYSSQSSYFMQTLAGVGLSRLELDGENAFLNRESHVQFAIQACIAELKGNSHAALYGCA